MKTYSGILAILAPKKSAFAASVNTVAPKEPGIPVFSLHPVSTGKQAVAMLLQVMQELPATCSWINSLISVFMGSGLYISAILVAKKMGKINQFVSIFVASFMAYGNKLLAYLLLAEIFIGTRIQSITTLLWLWTGEFVASGSAKLFRFHRGFSSLSPLGFLPVNLSQCPYLSEVWY